MRAEEEPFGEVDWIVANEVSGDEELIEDEEVELLEEMKDVSRLALSKQEKKELRRPWLCKLIIKLDGKSVPYNFLVEYLQLQWKIRMIWR